MRRSLYQKAQRHVDALQQEAKGTVAKGFVGDPTGPVFKMDDTILSTASAEFKNWFKDQKESQQGHVETFRATLEAQALAAANAARPLPAVPDGDGMDTGLAEEDFDKLAGNFEKLRAAKAAASSATSAEGESEKAADDFRSAKRIPIEQLAAMAKKKQRD